MIHTLACRLTWAGELHITQAIITGIHGTMTHGIHHHGDILPIMEVHGITIAGIHLITTATTGHIVIMVVTMAATMVIIIQTTM